MISLAENSRIQGQFKALGDFPVLFKADLIFKDFSRKPSKFKYFSSLCEPCISENKFSQIFVTLQYIANQEYYHDFLKALG